jgi:cell division protein FtsW
MKRRGTPDFLLLFLTLLLVGGGLVMVFSASAIQAYWVMDDKLYFTKRQLLWAGIGLLSMLVAMNIPYRVYQRRFLLILGVTVILLLSLYLPGIGQKINGARSWINIAGFTIQPSETAKIALIIYLAALIDKKKERLQDFKTGLLPALLMTGFIAGLVLAEPDTGTAAIILAGAGVVMLCGGARIKHLFRIALPVLAIGALYIAVSPYRRARITSYLDPWKDPSDSGYQLIHSFYAIVHGGINGAGFGKSIEKYLYLPYPQTDFIFSVITEELGFIGVAIFMFIFVAFIWRALIVSLRSPSLFGNLVGVGLVSMIAVQAFINIGGVTGSIPITGVPLPFISYGGSSLVIYMTSVGIILSISRESSAKVDEPAAVRGQSSVTSYR